MVSAATPSSVEYLALVVAEPVVDLVVDLVVDPAEAVGVTGTTVTFSMMLRLPLGRVLILVLADVERPTDASFMV